MVAVADPAAVDVPVDDLILLAPDAELIEATSPKLADFGVCALIGEGPLARKVNVDVGRVHYNRWVYVGGTSPDVARAYADLPVRSALRQGGSAWFIGAGGPMGRMHVQRAIQVAGAPAVIVCTDVSDLRLADLQESYGAEAAEKGIEFICLNPMNKEAYAEGMARFREGGFDDVIVLAPVPALIADGATWLAPEGVMNVFAGVGRGTMAPLDLGEAYLKQTRVHRSLGIEHRRPARDAFPGRDRLPLAQPLRGRDRLAGSGTRWHAGADGHDLPRQSRHLPAHQAAAADRNRRTQGDAAGRLRQAEGRPRMDERGRGGIAAADAGIEIVKRDPCCVMRSHRKFAQQREFRGSPILSTHHVYHAARYHAARFTESPMSNTLANQVALVTGGAQGLGQAICLRLANEGCDVAVADIKLEQAQATADLIVKETGRRGLAIMMDVTDEASVQAGFARTVKNSAGWTSWWPTPAS